MAAISRSLHLVDPHSITAMLSGAIDGQYDDGYAGNTEAAAIGNVEGRQARRRRVNRIVEAVVRGTADLAWAQAELERMKRGAP